MFWVYCGREEWITRTATIFDLKEFAVHDGPGIRQTVFFKGCPLRCQWCHNPEGLSPYPQLMYSRSSCIHCGKCREVCPASEDACTACGRCVEVCPLGLRQIVGHTVSPEQLADRLRVNSGYYASVGGGVTFSGGEPLMQGEFLLELLPLIPDMHTAIETCGYCSPSLFRRVIGGISFIMMDFKLADPKLHRRYTGKDNAPILENLKWLCQSGRPFVIRVPLIPGVTDTASNLEAITQTLEHAEALTDVELLPYHKTAGAKYSMIGQEYRPDFDVERKPELLTDLFTKHGIRSRVL